MKPENGKAKLDERFLINIQGNDFVRYEGLFSKGREQQFSNDVVSDGGQIKWV